MIFLIIFYGILFLIIGYVIKFFQDQKQTRFEEIFYYKFKNFNLLSTKTNKKVNKKPKLFLLKNEAICIHPNISAALQEIFDFILVKYINSWYQGFSNNEDFVVEIKAFFHTILAEVLVRLSKVDITVLVTDKVLPAIVNHLDICYHVMESYNGDSSSSSTMQDVLLQRMKSHLHVVMISRADELAYLRCVSKHIIPLITPDYLNQTDNKTCFYLLRECFVGTVLLPTMDTLASPDIINKLICLLLESSSPNPVAPIDVSIQSVPILHRYQQAWINRLKSQKNPPKGIENFLRNEKNLYHFLQFIKFLECIPPINFFLLIDSITIKLLNPELNETDKISLFGDLKRLNDLMDSVDDYSDLNVSLALHLQVKEVLTKGHQSVHQLINSEIWMENYNSICQYTESVYLNQYFESEFYLATIYGDRERECSLDSKDKREDFSKHKFGNTIKNALSFTGDDSIDACDLVDFGINYPDGADHMWADKFADNFVELPDLSSMRVKIPSISQPQINKYNKNEFYFSINTFRIDSEELICKVYRKYNEFYVLEQKLMEFHGTIGRNLPSKKPWDSKKVEYLDHCKFDFETYLMFLVNRPFLKNSQLLYRFLTIPSEFNANTPIEVNLGRFVKSVPMKLAKEKGQFLDKFLTNFHVSCDSSNGSQKSGAGDMLSGTSNHKISYDPITKSLIDNRMHMNMFWNNAGFMNVTTDSLLNQVCTFSNRFIFSFYDTVCLIYDTISRNVAFFSLLLNCLYRLRPLLLKLVESFVANSVKTGVQKICSEKFAVDLIHILRDSVLITGYMRTNSEKAERRDEALKCFRTLVPEWISFVVNDGVRDSVLKNLDRVFDCLQQPKLNKQLSYVLLDIVIVELFPELAEQFPQLTSNNKTTILSTHREH